MMMLDLTTLFTLLTIASAVSLLYPYIIYPFLLRLLPQQPICSPSSCEPSQPLHYALLFCAHNEEAILPKKIENLRMLKRELPNLRILAYSDCSTDATNELLSEASHTLEPVFGDRRIGKVMGMQLLVEKTDADILIFTDANVTLESGALQRLVKYFADPGIGAVAATLVYDKARQKADSSVTARVGGLYWRLEEQIKRLETLTGSTMGADGSFFARYRRGYPKIPADLVDDMAVSFSVLFDGLRCISASDVVGHEAFVTDRDEEFRRRRRIACGSYSTYRFMQRRIGRLKFVDRFKFYSHKLLRWWGAFFLVTFFLSFLATLFVAGIGTLGFVSVILGSVVFILLGRLEVPVVAPAYEILTTVVATGIGVAESLAGRRYETWDPAKTR